MKNVLFFDAMLMPKVIVFIYWMLLAAAVILGLTVVYNGSLLGGLLAVLGGVLGARLYCELMIVLFKINDNLQRIADRQDASPKV